VSVGGTPLSGSTDDKGIYHFGDVSPGTYTVSGQKDNYSAAADSSGGSASQTLAAPAGATTLYKLVLYPPVSLKGTVTNQTTGKPISGATVKLDGPGAPTTTADPSGNYHFDNLERGKTFQVSSFMNGLADGGDGHATANPTNSTAPVNLKLRQMTVAPNKNSLIVVLDKNGNAPAAYPILTFTIANGPPGQLFDLQVSRDGTTPSGGPGIPGSWDSSKSIRDRQSQKVYSSWSDGKTSLRLDGSGAATFQMPLDWWRDLARIPLASFSAPIPLKYRVIAFPDAASQPSGSTDPGASPSLEVKNNLVSFQVVDLGYTDGGITKSIRMEFTVSEANTTDMYTFVQWMQGGANQWIGPGSAATHPTHRLYDIIHIYDFPDFTIDRLHTNPRYWDGTYTISADNKTASATDGPNQGAIAAPYTHFYNRIDFETRVHLNFDVPAAVNVTRKDGAAPVFGVVTGNMVPDPVTLASQTWQLRALQVLSGGATTVTHPDTFAGP
jgi:hypothetical protein